MIKSRRIMRSSYVARMEEKKKRTKCKFESEMGRSELKDLGMPEKIILSRIWGGTHDDNSGF
jgi:hypothetical protein